MFPWLAFGHLIPYLELAMLIAQKGQKIPFISTRRNIDRLPKIPDKLAPLINFVKLSLPHDEDLPENAEATADIPQDKVPYLKKVCDALQEHLDQFFEASSPNWIFYDFAHYWVPPIAAKLGISRAFFSIFNAWSTCFLGPSMSALINGDDPRRKFEEFPVPPEWVPFTSNVAFRIHEAKKFVAHNPEASITGQPSDAYRLMGAMSGCDIFVQRSCFEIESEWLKLVGDLHQKCVIPSGLLPPSITLDYQIGADSTDDDIPWATIRDLLSKQSRGSVVYVALGSEVTLCQEEVNELALGLEISRLPFFWASRNLHDDLVLPDGFEERIKGRGIVWKSWAPQQRILAHGSIGGFLTHCGWSSIIEGLNFGRALIMLPFNFDQGLNSRIFEEKMAGIEIPRDEQNGSFTADSVAKTLRIVIAEDKDGFIGRKQEK